jgi:hypothetical protein
MVNSSNIKKKKVINLPKKEDKNAELAKNLGL